MTSTPQRRTPLFNVLVPGISTTVQDLGKTGRARFGIAAGGAVDPVSLRLANALARNPANTPALEITLTGPTLEVLGDALLAITGAEMTTTINGHTIPNGHSFRVRAGDLVSIGRRRHGARAYLAVDGGFERGVDNDSPRIAKDEILGRWGTAIDNSTPLIHLSKKAQPAYGTPAILRILEGPQWNRLSTHGRASLLESEFDVGLDSNRTGIRLAADILELAEGEVAGIISEPTPLGTIQLPASGQPIILMADRPTTGGYAKIATVATIDIPVAGQLAPGDRVRFRAISLNEAQSELRRREIDLRLIERVATWSNSER